MKYFIIRPHNMSIVDPQSSNKTRGYSIEITKNRKLKLNNFLDGGKHCFTLQNQYGNSHSYDGLQYNPIY